MSLAIQRRDSGASHASGVRGDRSASRPVLEQAVLARQRSEELDRAVALKLVCSKCL